MVKWRIFIDMTRNAKPTKNLLKGENMKIKNPSYSLFLSCSHYQGQKMTDFIRVWAIKSVKRFKW